LVRTAALGTAGAAAFALACGGGGGGDDNAGNTGAKQEAAQRSLSDRADTTAQATPGGIFQGYTTADVTNMDPLTSPSFTANALGAWHYSRLLRFKTGFMETAPTGEVEGDLAETFEQPDPLRVILRLRPNAVWDERPPTNKRPVDADDVVFSWKRFEAGSIARQNVANSTNPSAPVESLEALDRQTVAIKLAFPFAPIGQILAFTRNFEVIPREAEGGFDPRTEARGSGAWILTDYQRNVRLSFKRNPNWFIKDRPFLDGWELPIVPEYAAGLAQFRAKRIWSFVVRQEDIIATKKDLPELILQQDDFSRACWQVYFGIRPGSPFLDERVRRAAAMLIDRDQWIDTFYNVDKFKAEGYPVDVRWNSHISSGSEGFWLDPRSDAFGEGKANFQYNPAEAKKLLAAAGYPQGISTDFTFITTSQYGTAYVQHAEVFKGMLEAHGDFKLKQNNPDYQTEFVPKYVYSKGNFNGIYVGATTTHPDPDGSLFSLFHREGNAQHVALDGKGGDERMYALVEAQRKEPDRTKRIAIVQEFQRYIGTKMYSLPYPGQSRGYSLAWPWIGNRGVFRHYDNEAAPQESYIQLWFDRAKFTG
jgi:peptide/nickel transport system substrate-binding protein